MTRAHWWPKALRSMLAAKGRLAAVVISAIVLAGGGGLFEAHVLRDIANVLGRVSLGQAAIVVIVIGHVSLESIG